MNMTRLKNIRIFFPVLIDRFFSKSTQQETEEPGEAILLTVGRYAM